MNGLKHAFSVMFHPIEGWDELMYHKEGKVSTANIIAVMVFFVLVMRRQLTGFIFNSDVKLSNLNIWFILTQSIILLLLFSIVNWAVCTLFDGKGRLKDIWITTNYSMIPFVISNIVYIILSNYMKMDEKIFLVWILYIGIIWTALLLIKGLESIHQYSIPSTLLSIVITIIGILIIIFLCVLLLSLTQQFIGFIVTVIKEIMIRKI